MTRGARLGTHQTSCIVIQHWRFDNVADNTNMLFDEEHKKLMFRSELKNIVRRRKTTKN